MLFRRPGWDRVRRGGIGLPAQRAARLGGGAFSPLQIPNLAAWYDATDITTLFQDTGGATPVTTNGQAVARWNDKSTNGNHLVQATAGNRSTFATSGANGLSALQIAHTSDAYPPTSTIPLTGAFTVYAIGNKIASKTWPLFGGTLNGSNAGIEVFSDGRNFYGTDAAGSINQTITLSGNLIIRCRRTAANECFTAATGLSETDIGALSGTMTIGHDAGAGFCHWDLPDLGQQFSEIIVYKADLVATGADPLIRAYLKSKYSLTVP